MSVNKIVSTSPSRCIRRAFFKFSLSYMAEHVATYSMVKCLYLNNPLNRLNDIKNFPAGWRIGYDPRHSLLLLRAYGHHYMD